MSRGGFHVEGLREAVRDLEAAEADVADLKGANAEIAETAAEILEGHTPRKSGRLRGTIRDSREKRTGVVTVASPYAGPILRGWPRRNIRSSRAIEKTDAEMEHEAPRIIERHLDRIFSKYGFN